MKQDRKIWILEDDAGCRFVYDEILGLRYDLSFFTDVEDFKRAAKGAKDTESPNLVIADIRFPGDSLLVLLASDNHHLLARLPFLVVSSVDDLDALRLCFDRGALDYITKPFGRAELVVKVERIFDLLAGRKDSGPNGIEIDPSTLTLAIAGKRSNVLTPREYQIVSVLSASDDNRLSRDEIVAKVWNSVQVSSKTLDVHLSNLRKKLKPLGMEIVLHPPATYQLVSPIK